MKLYKCNECGMQYKDRKIAEKCQAWCKKYKSCNIELIKFAVNK